MKLSRLLFVCCLAPLLSASVAHAQSTTDWTGGTGSWFSAGNWSAGEPTPVSIARINNGGTAQIAGGFAQADAVTIGSAAGQSGTLAVFSIFGVRGDLSVNGTVGLLVVGGSGSGTLRISGQAKVQNEIGGVGSFGTGSGSATVSGSGARWENLNLLSVGGGTGSATLLIENGGSVFSEVSYVASLVGASATVTGAGSNWFTRGSLQLGNSDLGDIGTLTVTNGGLVRVDGQVTIYALSRVVIGTGAAAGTLQTGGVVNSGTLHFNHTGATTFSGHLSGTGLVLKDGSGSSTITSAASYTGAFWVNNGQLILHNTLAAKSYFANDGLRFEAATVNQSSTGSIRVNGGGTVEYNNSTVNGGFLRGPGTHRLLAGGTNAFNGVTTFNSTAILQDGTAHLNNFINGGTLTSNATLNFDGGVNASSGVITVNGTLFARDFTNNGVVNINNGGVVQTDAGNLVSGGGSRTTVNAGGEVFISDDTTWELNGALLVNNGTINGTTNINYGSLATGTGSYGVVNVNQGGVFSPGNSPGLVTAESLHFSNTSVDGPILAIELGGTVPGSEYDQVNVTGDLSLGGTLNVSLLPGFNPAGGDSFDILDWSSLSGTFSSLALPTLAGLSWNTSQLYTTGVLTVAAAGLPGDYNQNGTVDTADYVVWRDTLGQTGTSLVADGNHNNLVDAGDYTVWRSNFGTLAGSGSAADVSGSTTVPEPSSILLLGILSVVSGFVRSGRQHKTNHVDAANEPVPMGGFRFRLGQMVQGAFISSANFLRVRAICVVHQTCLGITKE